MVGRRQAPGRRDVSVHYPANGGRGKLVLYRAFRLKTFPEGWGVIGRNLGHYQILEKLGEGGMGVVYKARDTHLDRFVALKVLPPGRVADPERKRRFVQEAKAASALNHPNIVHIYDIAEADGLQFIAMECVGGKTLDQLIPRKGSALRARLNETLKMGVQIADALSRAHAAGIVHRDLKPSNVMVDEHGLVKLLDFGLAKLTETTAPREDEPTRTLKPETQEGTIVGTVGYMSPEQAEGKPVDARSDIFSFGSMLYEMATGRRAFHGGSNLSTLAAILNQEPEPLPAEIPHDLERVIARCLRKDPARRFQTMADLRVALEELREESESGRFRAPAVAAARPRRQWFWMALGAVVLVAAGTFAGWKWLRPAPAGPPTIQRITRDGLSVLGALSPDGKLLTYCRRLPDKEDADLWLQQVEGGEPARLTDDPAEDLSPAFSPDGTRIVFRSTRGGGGIFVMPALGGESRRVAPDGEFPVFSPDGAEIAYASASPGLRENRRVHIVSAAGGTPAVWLPDYVCQGWPIWSPDGSQIMLAGVQASGPRREQAYWIAARAGGQPKAVDFERVFTERGRRIRQVIVWQWLGSNDRKAPESFLVSVVEGDTMTLCRLPVSPAGEIRGRLEPVASAMQALLFPSVAAGGKILFTGADVTTDLWELPLDTDAGRVSGPLRQITAGHGVRDSHSISRDGSRVAFPSSRPGRSNVVLRDLKARAERVLHTGRQGYSTSISPDGAQVAFTVPTGRGMELHVSPAEGGPTRKVADNAGVPNGWLPDGSGVLCQGGQPSGIFLIDLATSRRTELLRHPTDNLHAGFFSADGAWITFMQRLRPGHVRLMAAPYRSGKAAGPDEWVPITDGAYDDDKPRLAPGGGMLYFRSNRDGFICVWAQRLDPRTKRPIGAPQPVQHFHGALRSYASLHGGQSPLHLSLAAGRLVVNLEEWRTDLWLTQVK